jgi:predicted phage terminase large subunit-like protein
VSEDVGLINPDWFKVEERAPRGLRQIRYWDRAATEPTPKNPDPDWTAGAEGGMDEHDELWITDMQHFQASPAGNEDKIRQTAEVDGREVEIVLEEEGGASGKDSVDHYQSKVLKGFTVQGDRPDKDKITRSKSWRAKAERGKVHLVRGPWVHAFLAECATFPHGKKDQVDAVSGLHKFLTEPRKFKYGALAKP